MKNVSVYVHSTAYTDKSMRNYEKISFFGVLVFLILQNFGTYYISIARLFNYNWTCRICFHSACLIQPNFTFERDRS